MSGDTWKARASQACEGILPDKELEETAAHLTDFGGFKMALEALQNTSVAC